MRMKQILVILAGTAAVLAMLWASGKGDRQELPPPELTETTAPPTATAPTTEESTAPLRVSRGDIAGADGTVILTGADRAYQGDTAEAFGNVFGGEIALDSRLAVYTETANATFSDAGDGSCTGQTVRTTFCVPLQTAIWEYLDTQGIEGSVTVIREDGAVEALVSRGGEGHYALTPATPGSVFKILSAMVSEHYFPGRVYSDPGSADGIHDWDYEKHPEHYPRETDIRSALVNSSNLYFGEVFSEAGAEQVMAYLDSAFLYSRALETDLGTLQNTIDVSSNANLLRAGFGQRETVTPVYLALCGNALLTGKLMQPYATLCTADCVTGEVLQTLGEPQILAAPGTASSGILEGLSGVAADLGLSYPAENTALYAKTGTAEISDDGSVEDIHYILVIVKGETTRTVVMQIRNSVSAFGHEYASGDKGSMQDILRIIAENV